MKLICFKCGEVFHYGGYWHPDLGEPRCYDCLGLNNKAEEASYTRSIHKDWPDEEEKEEE